MDITYNKFLSMPGYLKTLKLLSLSGNKSVTNVLDGLANVMKITSMKLSNRTILFNNEDEFCSYPVSKMASSILKLLPSQIFEKFPFFGTNLSQLTKDIKLLGLFCSMVDTIVNYKKMFPNGITSATIFQIISEAVFAITKTMISAQISALLLGTPLQVTLGPIMFMIENLCSRAPLGNDSKYNFFRGGVSEIYEFLSN